MAFVANGPDEEEDKNNPAQGPIAASGGGGVHLAPSPGLVSGGGGGGSASGGKGSSTQPGGQFASLGQYVQANTPNASALTDKVISPINAQADASGKQVDQTLSDVRGQVSGGYTPQDTGLLDKANQDIVSFANDPNNVKAFQGQLKDSYTGPTSAESTPGYQKTFADISGKLSSIKPLTQTTSGQGQLLKNIEKNPGNPGVTGLNEAILSQDPDSSSRIAESYKPFENLLGNLQSGASAINPTIAAAQGSASAANKAANKIISDNAASLNNIPTAASAAEASRNAYNSSVSDFQDKASPFEQIIKAWAGSLPSVAGNYVPDMVSPIIEANKPVNTPITAANFASPSDYARAKALSTLSPDTQTPLNASDSAQAGTAPKITMPTFQTLSELATKYAPSITKAFQSDPRLANGSGWGPSQQIATSQAQDLAKYLSQFDPNDFAYNPDTGYMAI